MCLTCGCAMPDVDHNDSRNITLLDLRSAAAWAGIDLIQAGANLSRTLSSSLSKSIAEAQRPTTAGLVLKADDEKRFLLTVAYPANKPDVAIAADRHIDVASADVVERACWDFARKGMKVGMWHKEGFDDAAVVVENYIWRGEPWVIKAADGTRQVIMPGDWLVGLVCQKKSWELYKAGYIGGVSPQGRASRQRPSEQTIEAIRRRATNG